MYIIINTCGDDGPSTRRINRVI